MIPIATTATDRFRRMVIEGNLPVHTDAKLTHTTENARIANPNPPALAAKLAAKFPRVKWLQDVVIPQAGQRIPKTTRIEQGGKPSC